MLQTSIPFYQQFNYALKWHSIETILYQLMLTTHQYCLFYVLGATHFGSIGTIFSLIYLFIALLDLGMTPSLSPFFKRISKSKRSFKAFLLIHGIPHLFLLVIFIPINIGILKKVFFNVCHLSNSLLLLIAVIIFVESIKKFLKIMLQLAFLNKYVALVELFVMVTYIIWVWGSYTCGFSITLYTVLFSLLFVSITSFGFYFLIICNWYTTLPDTHDSFTILIAWAMLKSRCYNYIMMMSTIIFSGNFLVPFFAIQFGLSSASVYKLLNRIYIFLSTIIQHTIGFASDAYFSNIKELSLDTKKQAFILASQKLYYILYAVLIFFIINFQKLLQLWFDQKIIHTHLVYIFLLISFSEHFYLVYKKFFIAEEKAGLLLGINLLNVSLLYVILYYAVYISDSLVLGLLFIVQSIILFLLSFCSSHYWQLPFAGKVHPYFLISVSIFSFLIHWLL